MFTFLYFLHETKKKEHILESAQYGLESIFKILFVVNIVSNVSKVSGVK